MKTGSENILKINSLVIGYSAGTKKEKVLMAPVDLDVREGEMVSLMGPNGIGKSTLLRTIACLHDRISGKILLSGMPLESYSAKELARRISFVFPGVAAVYNMTVHELVSLGRFPHTNWLGRLSARDTEIVKDSINSVGLYNHINDRIGELSDGERQRVMIARALSQDTKLMLLDEPTAFLDLPNRYELISLLRNLSDRQNKSVIFSSHDIDIAIRETDKVWLAGKKGIVQGSPEDLALNGKFEGLFPDSELTFVQDEGFYKYPVRTRMRIKLNGEDIYYYWTERALNRLGIRAEPEAITPSVTIINAEGRKTWVYESSVTRKQFTDLYSLVLYMRDVLKGD